MRVFLQNLDGYTCTIDIELTDNGDAVAAKVQEKIGIDPIGLRPFFGGRRFEGGSPATVAGFNIRGGDTLRVCHRGPMQPPSS